MLKQTMIYQLNDLKTEWERNSDRRLMLKNINREVDNRLKINEFTVEDRRERSVIVYFEMLYYLHVISQFWKVNALFSLFPRKDIILVI